MQANPPRPTGVTILAILAILVGIGGLVGGALMIAQSGTLAEADKGNELAAQGYPGLVGLGADVISLYLIIIGVVSLVMGMYLAVGVGFWGGKSWAGTLGMIASVIAIIFAIAQLAAGNVASVIALIFGLVVIYYLTRTNVKAFFGKAPWTPPAMGGTMMGTESSMGSGSMPSMSPPAGGATMIRCASCGAMSPAGTAKCPSCGAAL